jgi:hypothetical protein
VLCTVYAITTASAVDEEMNETIRFFGENPYPVIVRNTKIVTAIQGINFAVALLILIRLTLYRLRCDDKRILLGEFAGLVPLAAYLCMILLLVSGIVLFTPIVQMFFMLLYCAVFSTFLIACFQLFIRRHDFFSRFNAIGVLSGLFAFVAYLYHHVSLTYIPL